jgi:hypothetical protein
MNTFFSFLLAVVSLVRVDYFLYGQGMQSVYLERMGGNGICLKADAQSGSVFGYPGMIVSTGGTQFQNVEIWRYTTTGNMLSSLTGHQGGTMDDVMRSICSSGRLVIVIPWRDGYSLPRWDWAFAIGEVYR